MQVAKYNANGNDFVIFHTFHEKDYSNLAIELCDRNRGVGADGLIVLVPHKELDFKWMFYNSDGSNAAMCGNGTRACAHYAVSNHLAEKSLSFKTGAGIISCEVEGDVVETELTTPEVLKEEFEEEGLTWFLIDTGVPHLVTLTEDLDKFDLKLCAKMRDKYNANVNFAKPDVYRLYVRTYERGVEDETGACGTGMAASFLYAYDKGLVEKSVSVFPTSKEELFLRIEDKKLYFKGAVKKVFETSIE